MTKRNRSRPIHMPGPAAGLLVAGIVFGLLILTGNSLASDGFYEIKAKFPSKAQSQALSDVAIDYGGKVRIVFNEGTLFRRTDSAAYDYFFIGRGEVVVRDSSGLTVAWSDHLAKRPKVIFESAYICGHELPDLLGLDPSGWVPDKIKRPHWNKLQFLLKAPDKYFGINPGAELNVWSEMEISPLPVWVDLKLDGGDQMAYYLSPDIGEQLHVYIYEDKYDAPYLAGGFELGDRIVSRPAEIDSTEIFIRLKESGYFEARCLLFFKDAAVYRRGLKLNLPYLFTVDSVLDVSGSHLPFFKKKRRGNFYLMRGPVGNENTGPVTVYYRGRFLISPYAGADTPVNMTGWFPHLPHRTLGRYSIHYTLHKDIALISVGHKTGEVVTGDQKTVTYRTGDNISYVSFASGIYDTLIETVNDVPVTLFIRRENNAGLFNRHIPGEVMADLTGAFNAFHGRFGPPLARTLEIVDRAAFTGQSSPGLIHLSQVSFAARRDQARFRAHEVAHQWWGHTAVPKSYRDMWLSEGLAEFSAGLYLLDHVRDSAAHRELVSTWLRQILEEGKIGGRYSRGYRAGSIMQGMRLMESYSPGDYIALVYAKAAYMLRMLRFEIDGPQYRTDFLSAMLAEYGRTYYGKQASSTDFMRVAREYIGPQRAQTFFTQWLYGWKIPGFVGEYAVTADDRGRRIVDIELRVTGVDEGFETPYPVEIEFANGTRELFRLDGIGRKNSHRLGPFPQKISRIRFDPDRIILARSVEVHEKQ